MKSLAKVLLLLAIVIMPGGCSHIGRINGYDVTRVAGENPNATFCQKNPAVCIVGAAAALGGTALVIRQLTKDDRPPEVTGGGGQ